MAFEGFFREHKDVQTYKDISKMIGLIYKVVMMAFYHICVIFIGIPLSIIWAFFNGIFVFFMVWIWGPILRIIMISILATLPMGTAFCQVLMAPMADAMARIFGKIRVKTDLGGNIGFKTA